MKSALSFIIRHMTEPTLEALVIRIVIALLLLAGSSAMFFAVRFWNDRSAYTANDDAVIDYLNRRTLPWIYYATVIGYFLLTGLSPFKEGAYTLPMLVYSMDKEVWMEIVFCISGPMIACSLWLFFVFRFLIIRAFLYIIFGELLGLSIGMLFGQLAEILMRLLELIAPFIGFLGYILFYGLILFQIFCLGRQLLYAAGLFLLSFFTDEALQEMRLQKHLRERSAGRSVSSGGGSSGGGSSGSSKKRSVFPSSIIIGGETYRLETESSDTAIYYCPRTGDRTTLRDCDMPGY